MRDLVSHAEIMLINQNEEYVVVCISVTGIGYKHKTRQHALIFPPA